MEISQIRFSLQELSIALVYENFLAATVVFPAISLKSLIQGVPIKTKPSDNHIIRYKITSKAGSRLCNNSPNLPVTVGSTALARHTTCAKAVQVRAFCILEHPIKIVCCYS